MGMGTGVPGERSSHCVVLCAVVWCGVVKEGSLSLVRASAPTDQLPWPCMGCVCLSIYAYIYA